MQHFSHFMCFFHLHGHSIVRSCRNLIFYTIKYIKWVQVQQYINVIVPM